MALLMVCTSDRMDQVKDGCFITQNYVLGNFCKDLLFQCKQNLRKYWLVHWLQRE